MVYNFLQIISFYKKYVFSLHPSTRWEKIDKIDY